MHFMMMIDIHAIHMYAHMYCTFPDVIHLYHPYHNGHYVYELQRKSGPSHPIQCKFNKDLNRS